MKDDTISRQAAINVANRTDYRGLTVEDVKKVTDEVVKGLEALPPAQPTEASCWGCNCTKMERLKEQKTFSEMAHLHDAETHDKRTETHGVCLDTISRQAAIDEIKEIYEWHDNVTKERIIEHFERLPSAQPDRDAVTMMEDGTLSITVDMDITNVGRILLNQKGTSYGALYYKE